MSAEATTVVPVRGEVTFTNVGDFDRKLERAFGDGARNLVIDLTEVTFIDSSGLSALLGGLGARPRARRRGRARARAGRAALDLPLPRRRPPAGAVLEPGRGLERA